jgi:preprotein translocase subunit SecA
VLNRHREVIYEERRRVLAEPDLSENILSMLDESMEQIVDAHVKLNTDEIEVDGLLGDVSAFMPLTQEEATSLVSDLPREGLHQEMLARVISFARAKYAAKAEELGSETMRKVEKLVTLGVIDRLWMEHLTAMEHMRHGIGLRAAAQQQPLVVYKKEGHAFFEGLLAGIKHDVASAMLRVSVQARPMQPRPAAPVRAKSPVVAGKRVGRNDPCPCGSGKKYKHCCGK